MTERQTNSTDDYLRLKTDMQFRNHRQNAVYERLGNIKAR